METVRTGSPSTPAGGVPPVLVITVGQRSYVVRPDDAPIVIGREFPAQIIINDDRISRTHVRIDRTPTGWVASDHSRNGTFVDGLAQSSIAIHDAMTIHLGNPFGIPVVFGFQSAPVGHAGPEVSEDDDAEQTLALGAVDPAVARAGAAVAARREELKLTQRHLAREGIVNAGTLVDFEKGRRWPRKSTRSKLEDALQWPPGTINRIRLEHNGPEAENTEVLTNSMVRAPLMAEAVELALTTITATIQSLPGEVSDPQFSARAGGVLADLRKLESVAANAAHSAKGAPEVALMLSAVRKCYKDLMLRAARAPGATLGQRLYAARYRAELSVGELANAAGVPVDVVVAAEAEQPLDAASADALSAALSALTRR